MAFSFFYFIYILSDLDLVDYGVHAYLLNDNQIKLVQSSGMRTS